MANNGQFPNMQPLHPPVPLGPPHVGPPPMPIQYRPVVVVPAPPTQPYNHVGPQQYQQVGFTHMGLPPPVPQYQFSHPLPARPVPQPLPLTEVQANRLNISAQHQPLQNGQILKSYIANSSSFTFGASSVGQLQNQTMPDGAVKEPTPVQMPPSDWSEYTSSRRGKKFYYNKKTKLSTWEKPLELMTPIERADATTDWREFKSPAGQKYYYNRVTKQSKWRMPCEVQLAREQVKLASNFETQGGHNPPPAASDAPLLVIEAPPLYPAISSSLGNESVSGPLLVENLSPVASPQREAALGPTTATDIQAPAKAVTPSNVVPGSADTSNTPVFVSQMSNVSNESVQDAPSIDDVSGVNEEAEKDKDGDTEMTASGEKIAVQEPWVYETKLDAKNAFKALLESANVGSDWTWDLAMKAIITDRRYGALRTLGERKQAFNEFLVQRKKQDAEEKRARHKKALEDFRIMLEESKEITSSTRWSKAIAILEDDERFKAVERNREKEDLFEAHITELQKKEKAKAMEEFKRNKIDYMSFLKSCDFITASSQWRKVQDRLESDERCLRLEKIDRLEIFQEYTRDLEREEEEQIKLRMEEIRKAERKNRDEFRNLMEEHIASGMLNANTTWRDYSMKVKELPAYMAVASNTSGSTAKDLFEDVSEELQKQFFEDKSRIKEAVLWRKVSVSSTWTLEDFRSSISEDISSPPMSDINLRLVFEELIAVAKAKEENEAKRRKRLADDFHRYLFTLKNITSSSKWEDCKKILEDRKERFLVEENFLIETFDKYIIELQEKDKERERRRREEKAKRERDAKDRERKSDRHSRDRGRETERSSRRGKGKRHRNRKSIYVDILTMDEDERDRSKSFNRHSSERKKSKQTEHHHSSEADSESRHKRHKKDHRHGSHRNGDHEEQLKDREIGEEGEVW